MRDIRLETMPFQFEGKTYILRCNMNVLADVQAEYGGKISGALTGENPTKSVLAFTAAMMNDYADEQGWPERFTAKDLGRKLGMNMLPAAKILGLVTRSITPQDQEDGAGEENKTEPDNSGN